jgi:predicted Zn-dependent peptidase
MNCASGRLPNKQYLNGNVLLQKTFIISAICWVFFLPAKIWGNEFEQPGFYDVEHYILPNGLQVILKPRRLAKNTAINLKVDVGHSDFTCGKRETAHFLEHLLFTGTDRYSEIELDSLIKRHGGTWNATTDREHTTYTLAIYSKYTAVGLNTLFHIMKDSTLTEANIETSRKILYREAGGKPSALLNWLHKNEWAISAVRLAIKDLLPGQGFGCNDLDNIQSVTSNDIRHAYRKFYTPSRMTLTIVGDFDSKKLKPLISASFGRLTQHAPAVNQAEQSYQQPDVLEDIYRGRLDPLLGKDNTLYLIYRTEGIQSLDYYPLTILEDYLHQTLFNELRIKSGLAYAPEVALSMYDDFGLFMLSTDADDENILLLRDKIDTILNSLIDSSLNIETLEKTKYRLLLSAARGYETNSSFADYYAENSLEIKHRGTYLSYEKQIAAVSAKDIQHVIKKYLRPDNRVVAIDSPALTYTQFYLLFAGLILLVGLYFFRHFFLKRRRRRSSF